MDGVYGSYYVMKHIAEQHLIGKNPLDVHRLQEDMRRGGLFKGAQGGMYVCVMSALETALWDLAGKALGLPVYQLLGGKFRDKIRVYCDTAGAASSPRRWAVGRRRTSRSTASPRSSSTSTTSDPRKLDRYNWGVASPSSSGWWRRSPRCGRVGPHVDICVNCHGRSTRSPGARSPRPWSSST